MSQKCVFQARRVLLSGDEGFPAGLSDLPDPPAQLDLAGSLPDLSSAVAIVGTRHTDSWGRAFTRRLVHDLVQAGCVIVSGGAVGIDAEAHEAALEASGSTVAVLANGLARPYPSRNHPLFQRIAERGCVLSEIVGHAPGRASLFLARNRLVAALSRVVVVIQAPLVSGALSTAAHAKRIGRPVLAVPNAPECVRSQGCLELLAQGAGICRSAGDVLSLAAPKQAEDLPKRPRRPKKVQKYHGLGEDEAALAGTLEGQPLDADELCLATNLPAPRVQRAILMLLLSGVIQEVGGGRYGRTDRP